MRDARATVEVTREMIDAGGCGRPSEQAASSPAIARTNECLSDGRLPQSPSGPNPEEGEAIEASVSVLSNGPVIEKRRRAVAPPQVGEVAWSRDATAGFLLTRFQESRDTGVVEGIHC